MEDQDILVLKKKTTSSTWTSFGFKWGQDGNPEDESTAECHLYRRSGMAKGSNTSNPFSHLKNAYPQHYAEARENQKQSKCYSSARTLKEKQPTLEATLKHTEKYDRKGISSGKKPTDCDTRVLTCIF